MSKQYFTTTHSLHHELATMFNSPYSTFKDFQNTTEYKDYIRYAKLLTNRAKLLNKPQHYYHSDKIMILYYTRERKLFIVRLASFKAKCIKHGLL